MTLPSGQVVTYGYNSNNQISSVAVGSTTLLSGVTYQPFGPVSGWTWGNATSTSRTFDSDGLLSQFDSAGLKTYAYDDAFRITGITDTVNSANSYTYGYDSRDRLTSAAKTGTTFGWTYDANGNRLTQARTGTSTANFTISGTNNRIASASGGSINRTYNYSASGSAGSYSYATSTYNNAGRMKSSSRGAFTAQYIYNALGERIRQRNGVPGHILYVYDESGKLLGEYTSAGVLIQETVWLGDIPVATLRPNGAGVDIYYVHSDHLNTPIRVTRPSDNAVMWTWNTMPFGADLPNENPSSVGTFVYNLRFPGQIYDATAGLHYNYFRTYDPVVGRYMESDPIGLKGGINTYAYVSSEPVSLIDPYGLYCHKEFVAHYFSGGAKPISLAQVGLSDEFRTSASVRASVKQFEARLKSRGRQTAQRACSGLRSGQKTDAFLETSTAVTNVTSETCLFSVGHSTFFRSAACVVNADCCLRSFSMRCSSRFGIKDRFADPVGVGREIPGGKPYNISDSWDVGLSHEGNF